MSRGGGSDGGQQTAFAEPAKQREVTVPIVEEQLQVRKREVKEGTMAAFERATS